MTDTFAVRTLTFFTLVMEARNFIDVVVIIVFFSDNLNIITLSLSHAYDQ